MQYIYVWIKRCPQARRVPIPRNFLGGIASFFAFPDKTPRMCWGVVHGAVFGVINVYKYFLILGHAWEDPCYFSIPPNTHVRGDSFSFFESPDIPRIVGIPQTPPDCPGDRHPPCPLPFSLLIKAMFFFKLKQRMKIFLLTPVSMPVVALGCMYIYILIPCIYVCQEGADPPDNPGVSRDLEKNNDSRHYARGCPGHSKYYIYPPKQQHCLYIAMYLLFSTTHHVITVESMHCC